MNVMFSRSKFGGSKHGYSFGNSKNSYGKKRNRTWIFLNKRKHKHEHEGKKDDDYENHGLSVITSGDPKLEIPDGIRSDGPVKNLLLPSSSGQISHKDELDAIEEFSKEPQPNTEKNGVNHHNKTKEGKPENDNECCVKCLYITQQCCECVIL